jgi:uncharacterized protein (DUF2235 family)
MSKKIAICFDGTWNTPDNNGDIDGKVDTNVCKLYKGVAKQDKEGTPQLPWYSEGVGTKWYNKVSGGAFGVGLSKIIQKGYEFLVQNYEDGDEVYIFGFSRGAYTARSLVGLIRNAGLLKREHLKKIPDAYFLYRTRDVTADSENAVFFRKKFSKDISIKFLGVWDTVGALGIPVQSFEWFNREFYKFHDTELSSIVRHAYHAIAIDEHRENYKPTLWDSKPKPNQTIEQVWFIGAHTNVGGGYPDSELSDITLKWMIDKAAECGLAFDEAKLLELKPNSLGTIRDSYKEFLGGLFSITSPRYYREIGSTEFGHEIISPSVRDRCKTDANYRPKNDIRRKIEGLDPGERIHIVAFRTNLGNTDTPLGQ